MSDPTTTQDRDEPFARGSYSTCHLDVTLYRATALAYAKRNDVISGKGAKIHGGRWNPPGLCSAVYASLSPEAALKEALATHKDLQIDPIDRLPLVVVALRCELQAVLDLTDRANLRRSRLSWKQIFDEDWEALQKGGVDAISQRIGRMAFERGFEGLIVRSARFPREKNLVIFPERLRESSIVQVLHVERLPN